MCKQIDSLLNGNKIYQDSQRFMFGIDAILLADFAAPSIKKGDTVIDLGTGTGIIPLLLDTTSKAAQITALEIQAESVAMAKESVALNSLERKIQIVEGDIKTVNSQFPKHKFNVVVSNPPYMAMTIGRESPNEAKAIARHEILCNLEDVIAAADYLLHDHGSFFMIHRPTRLPEIMTLCKKYNMEPKVLRMVVPAADKEPTMVLLEARKDAKPELKILNQLVVYKEPKVYSDEVQEIYKKIEMTKPQQA